MGERAHKHIRAMGAGDMTLFTVSAILLLDTLAASASIGVSSLFWWLLLGVLFFIPYGLISAELGTTYPEQGGIYAWVRDAFGTRWGTRVTWLYWFNTVLWNASIYILFAGIFAQMFFPGLPLAAQLGLAIGLNWLVIAIASMSLKVGKWIPNIGALLKIVTFTAIVLGGAAFLAGDAELANEFNWSAFKPEWSSGTQYVSTIIYGMLGFELMSAASEEMKHPRRDIPRAILCSGAIIFSAYYLGTTAILMVIPAAEINLVEGLVDTLRVLFGGSAVGAAIAVLLGSFALFTFFSNGTTWAIGSNRAAAEAAIDGELPCIFAREHPKYGIPVGAATIMGVLITLVLLAYGAIAGTNEELFWSLFASSAVLFLLPYLGAVASFYRARQIDADRTRPFEVPGGNGFAWLITFLCIAILSLTIVLFMYVPGSGFDWPVVAGASVSLVIGELVIRYAEREHRTLPGAASAR